MSMITLLVEIQNNKKVIEEYNKIIKNVSYINKLKMFKEEFNQEKAKFKEKEGQIEDIREKYQSVTININDNKKESEKIKFELYNEAGSDFKLIDLLQKKDEEKQQIIKLLDNESLELLQKEEKLCLEKESLRLKLSKLKYSFYKCKDSETKKITKAKHDLKKAELGIRKAEKLIPKDILKSFNSICDFKGTGAGGIQNDICLGCNVKVSSMTLDSINRGERIVCCDNCGRMVYCNENKEL